MEIIRAGGGGTSQQSVQKSVQVVGKKNQASFNSSVTYAGSKGGNTYCQRVVFAEDCYDVQFLFVNPVSIVGRGTTKAINLKVTLETTSVADGSGNSTFYPLTANGLAPFVVNPDQQVLTDKFTRSFAKGEIVYLRIFISSTSNVFPTGPSLSAGYTGEGVLDGDYTNYPSSVTARFNNTTYSINGTTAGGTGTPTHENSWKQPGLAALFASDANGYAAALTLGKLSPTATRYPIVAIVGDSISRGTGADGSFTWGIGYGFIQQAVNANEGAWVDLGLNGESASGFTGFDNERQLLLDYCTHAIVEYGVNDISLTAASDSRITTITGNLQTIFNICREHGIGKIFATTPVVRTNSSDAWATTINQTAYNAGFTPRAGGGNNTWQDLTSWIKGNSVTPNGGSAIAAPANLDGNFDTASAVIVLKANNTPVWGVGKVYADSLGVHPSTTGHAAMAAVIPASAFAV